MVVYRTYMDVVCKRDPDNFNFSLFKIPTTNDRTIVSFKWVNTNWLSCMQNHFQTRRISQLINAINRTSNSYLIFCEYRYHWEHWGSQVFHFLIHRMMVARLYCALWFLTFFYRCFMFIIIMNKMNFVVVCAMNRYLFMSNNENK